MNKQRVQDINFVGTLHCALENGADLYVNERQKIGHYRARSNEECQIPIYFFTSSGAYVNCAIIAMLLSFYFFILVLYIDGTQ